jgi:hypothetical protein
MQQFTSANVLKSTSINQVMLIHVFMILVFAAGCKKETIQNTAPEANAGQYKYIATPADTVVLKGHANDKENNVVSYSWRKVSGPAAIVIENPNSLETKVRNLEVGEYEFELTVIDSYGLQGRGTVKVFVLKVGQNEVIFKDLTWEGSLDWGFSVAVNNFSSFVPQGTLYLVFLRNKFSNTWTPVLKAAHSKVTDKYGYGVSEDGDTIYINANNDVEGEIDVKVQF